MRGEVERFQKRTQFVYRERLLEKIALVIRDLLFGKKLLRVAASRSGGAEINLNFRFGHCYLRVNQSLIA